MERRGCIPVERVESTASVQRLGMVSGLLCAIGKTACVLHNLISGWGGRCVKLQVPKSNLGSL